ncbi:signal peptide peptidase-like 2B [Lineus longissimus]|uniref:signal peptide peptidase-like 2B n=1 Tax=Lineus longissimus TaxID=88925 RepID=UPI002B4D7E8B
MNIFCDLFTMKRFSNSLSLFVCVSFISMVSCDYGILLASVKYNDSAGHKFCLAYNPSFQDLPTNQEEAPVHKMADLMSSFGCEASSISVQLEDKVVVVKRGNCSFSDKAYNVYNDNATAMIVINMNGTVFPPGATNLSDYANINMTVAMITKEDYDQLKSLGPDLNLQLFQATASRVDYNLILIWIMAVFTIFIGAYWAGVNKHQQYLKNKLTAGMPRRDEEEGPDTSEEVETLDVSPLAVIFFVILIIGMLLALYFFYDYLVYAVIGLFCLASCIALHGCLKPVVAKIPICTKQLPPNKIPILSSRPEIRNIVLFFCCSAVVIWWAIERKAGYAWVLQDFLGIVFCVHMMKTIRLPNLKACTILLLLLFVYDIFFVFITPLITKGKQSIMVQVATGQGSTTGEQLPMVLKVPRFIKTDIALCHIPYSLLGFGDVLVPGLLISYIHGFDLRVQSRCRIYFMATLVAYGLGLLVTFCALIFMEIGQPALLYLVPFTLITVFSISIYRREFRLIWKGEAVIRKSKDKDLDTADNTINNDVPIVVVTTNGITASMNNRRPSPSSDGEPENVRLLSDST